MIVIDLGGCVGVFTDEVLKNPEVTHVYCVEPLKVNYDHLEEKYKDEDRVSVFYCAISNFNGEAKFYKKQNPQGKTDYLSCAGSSLKSDKKNVTNKFDTVEVFTLEKFMLDNNIANVGILKVDTEGSEYDIIGSILDNIEDFDKIYYEDHVRKVPSIRNDKERIEKEIISRGIISKFFTQEHDGGADDDYSPLKLKE